MSLDFNLILEEGSIIDNRRKHGTKIITLKDVLKTIAKDSEGLKCAIGYMYLEGLALILDELRSLKEIKILMGTQTTKLTKNELIKAFSKSFETLSETKENISAVVLFHSLIKESKTLKILAYFGEGEKRERLHSKAYLFLRNVKTDSILDRYKAGIIGSSNLTPSGLVGNAELNVIITEPKNLKYLESWFDELWKLGSDNFERLQIPEAISTSIEKSKFAKHIKEAFVYTTPEEFFKILIKYMNADYLFDDWKESKLFAFQQVDSIRCLRLFKEKNYRGVFLTSSVGLGKSYVACQIAIHFVQDKKKVLIIAPSGLVENEDMWPRYLSEFNLRGKIDIVGMGKLQKDPVRFDEIDIRKYEKNYSLIIVDEAHNYRNVDAYRTRNLRKIIDRNGDSVLLFLTATPINTSLEDLVNLIRLFHRPGHNLHFDKIFRYLLDIVRTILNTPYNKLTKKQKNELIKIQEEVESQLFVKSTRETIKTSPAYVQELKTFTNIDITDIPDPEVNEVVYSLDDKYKEIVNGIVDFINSLTAAHLRVLDPEKGARLGPFFKWILYKRFESDISSYYLTLKRILKKNQVVSKVIEEKNIKFLENIEDDEEIDDQVDIAFTKEYREKLGNVINKIKSGKGAEHLAILHDLKQDIKLIQSQVNDLEFFLQDKKGILFLDDRKLSQLLELIRKNKSKKLLIFTEYKDTLKTLEQFLIERFEGGQIEFVESGTRNKKEIIDRFNDSKNPLSILISTDTLSEGFNISGADIVVNFDIPYNPVRLIQRIGRATRLDAPKQIAVFNFRPDEDIDKELILVERLQIRIEDIIRFIGLEYRIWFEREEELLRERRKLDIKIYQDAAKQILKGVRQDLWKGKFNKLESSIEYSNPVMFLMQQAIKKFGIKKEDVTKKRISHNSYTLLTGNKNLAFFYDDAKTFNESAIQQIPIEEFSGKKIFEKEFANELRLFKKHLEIEKKDEIILSYYNDRIDRQIRSIIDKIYAEKLEQYFPALKELRNELLHAKEKCGDSTGQIIRQLHKDIRSKITNKKIQEYVKKLQNSYTQKMVQTKLISEKKPYLSLGYIDE